jgi:hypothetical protein
MLAPPSAAGVTSSASAAASSARVTHWAWSVTAATCPRTVALTHWAQVAEAVACDRTLAAFFLGIISIGRGVGLGTGLGSGGGGGDLNTCGNGSVQDTGGGVLHSVVSVHRSSTNLGSDSGALGHSYGLRRGFLSTPGGFRFSSVGLSRSVQRTRSGGLFNDTTYWAAS